jgi:hypothetical protein
MVAILVATSTYVENLKKKITRVMINVFINKTSATATKKFKWPISSFKCLQNVFQNTVSNKFLAI